MALTEGGADVLGSVEVDDEGLTLRGDTDFPLDVLFEDRRIFSFWLLRDTEVRGDTRFFPWPTPLHRFLDGTTHLRLIEHVSGDELYAQDLRLGTSDDPILVADDHGNPLGLDKSMRLTRLFQSRSEEHLAPLLDAMEAVLAAIEEAGVEPFLAYGTLLGAVRDGGFIGHDSDADLGYVSKHTHPAEASMESFRIQRRLVEMGFSINRYSGLAFKVVVRESDGLPRGLDVFGGLMVDDHLYLMGEVGHPFKREWIEPRSEVLMEGRPFPAPAEPDHMLEAMYGESWRVPDPAFKFETPYGAQRRLNGWFRGTRVGIDHRWATFDRSVRPQDGQASGFVRWVRKREPGAVTAIEIGCGSGRDALWLAKQGVQTVGLDYFPAAFRKAAQRGARRSLPVTFEWANLSEIRSVLVTGARLSRLPGPRVVLARHVVDATDRAGREHLLRLAKMTVRGSGKLYLQLRTGPVPGSPEPGTMPLDLEQFLDQVHQLGGTVEQRIDLPAPGVPDDPAGSGPHPHPLTRLVITWLPRTA